MYSASGVQVCLLFVNLTVLPQQASWHGATCILKISLGLTLLMLLQQAQQASAAKEKGTQQHPMTSSSAHAEQCVQRSTCQEARQQHRTPQQQQQQQPAAPQQELQLASFTKLRQAVNARDLYRRTPLIIAAKQGHLECTEILVESASNLFAVDREGNT